MENHQELKTKIKTLISENKIEAAIELLAAAQFSALDKELIILNSQYNRVLEEARLNLISKEEADRRLNNVTMALIKISDKIGAKKSALDQAIPGNTLNTWQKALLILVPALAIVGLIYWAIPSKTAAPDTTTGPITALAETPADSTHSLPELPNSLTAAFLFNGNANDSKGDHHGTVNGASATTDRNGKPNGAYAFEQTDAQIKFPPILDDTSNNYTIAFRIKNNKDAGAIFGQSFIVKKGALKISVLETRYAISLNKGYLDFKESLTSSTFKSASRIPKDVWVHIVFVRENNNLKLFLNGELNKETQMPSAGKQALDQAADANLGAQINANAQNKLSASFQGSIDDLYIFKEAIGPETVQKLYAAQ